MRCDFFDVHATLGAGHDERTAVGAIQQHGQVELLEDFLGGGHEDGLHDASFGSGLNRDKGLAEHVLGKAHGLFDRFGQFDAALEAVREGALAAPAGVDLGLDHRQGVPGSKDFLGRRLGLGDGLAGLTGGNGDAMLLKQLLGLVLVDVHSVQAGSSNGLTSKRRVIGVLAIPLSRRRGDVV